jgi:hypothetical protein
MAWVSTPLIRRMIGRVARGGVVGLVEFGDQSIEVGRGEPLDPHRPVDSATHFLHRRHVDGLAHGQPGPAVAGAAGHGHPALAGEAVGRTEFTPHRRSRRPFRPARPA